MRLSYPFYRTHDPNPGGDPNIRRGRQPSGGDVMNLSGTITSDGDVNDLVRDHCEQPVASHGGRGQKTSAPDDLAEHF